MADIRDMTVRIRGETSDFEKSMHSAGQASEEVHTSFLKMTGAITAGQAIYAAASAGFNKISESAKSVIDDTIELGRETMKMQREVGISAEAASGLISVFKRFGVDSDGASKSLGIFSKNIYAVSDPAKYASSTFADLSIKVKDAHGNLKTADQVFLEVADRFKAMPNGIEKTADAMKLFGKSGKDLIPVLNMGRDGIAELEDHAKKMGLVLSQDNVDAIRKNIIAQKDYKEAVEGVKLQIGNALMPVLTNFAKALAQFVSSDTFHHWTSIIITDLKDFVTWFKEVSKKAEELGKKVEEYLGPKLKDLWDTIKKDLIPTMKSLWHDVIEPLIPVIGVTLVAAIGFVIDATKDMIKVFAWVKKEIQDGNPIIILLTGAFVGLAAAMAFNAVFNALTMGFTALRLVTIPSVIASVETMQAAILAPLVMPAIAVGAALAALGLVIAKAIQTQQVVQQMHDDINKETAENNAAIDGLLANSNMSFQKIYALQKSTNYSGAHALANDHGTITAQFASGGFTGVGGSHEIAGIVHKGEYVLPQSAVDQNTGMPKIDLAGGGKSNVNLTVNVGMYAGMPVEKRQIALELYKELVRAARAQGVQMQMIGAMSPQ